MYPCVCSSLLRTPHTIPYSVTSPMVPAPLAELSVGSMAALVPKMQRTCSFPPASTPRQRLCWSSCSTPMPSMCTGPSGYRSVDVVFVFQAFPPLLMACPFVAAALCPLFPRIGNVRAQLMHILGTAYFHLGKLLLATDAYTVVSPCERGCRFAWKRGKALQSMFGSDSGVCTRDSCECMYVSIVAVGGLSLPVASLEQPNEGCL
jgi:hypothetical protein